MVDSNKRAKLEGRFESTEESRVSWLRFENAEPAGTAVEPHRVLERLRKSRAAR
jgi:hypothetical protein